MFEIKTCADSGIMYRESVVKDPRCVVVCVHGLGAHSAWWSSFAAYCQAHSVASLAIELRGFGETTDMRGHVDSFSTYFKDVVTLLKIAGSQYPGKKVFLIGESMGGLIAFVMASFKPSVCDGVVCLSPAFKDKNLFAVRDYVRILCALLYARRKQFDFPFTPEMCTRDTEWQEVIATDARTVRSSSAQLLVNIGIQQFCARLCAKEITLPIALLLAGKDSIIDSAMSKKIFSVLPGEDKVLIEYALMRHSLSVDLEKEHVYYDCVQWLKKHTD